MLICRWEKLPQNFQIEDVRPYFNYLRKKNFSLFFKRVFDIFVSGIMLVFLFPLFLLLAIAIKIDSKGPVFFRQERITQYGKKFRIFKFRSMFVDTDQNGPSVTTDNDTRITKVGKFIRKFRIDELSQVIDVFRGKMTFVGTRPEVSKYVDRYQNEYLATLLLPAGITSFASITFKDEEKFLLNSVDVDEKYINDILPKKMEINLLEIKKYSFWRDIKIMFMTVFAVFIKRK